jgi:hypothetical protein
MHFPHGETVTVVSTTTTDNGLGDTTTETVETSWGPCAVWDRYADESASPNAPRVVVGLAIAGPRVAIDSDDAILLGGVRYVVDGRPTENTVNPFTGWDPGIVVNVKRAGGV